MKKRVLFGVLIILLILNLSFIIAQENETVEDKAYECLEDKVGDCSSLTSFEDKIFSLLAIGECKDEVSSDLENKYDSNIKLTAQAILALDKVGVDTTTAETWLLSQNTTPESMDWLLQIESTEETTCTIDYGGWSFPNIIIREDKTISNPAGACLTKYGGGYWFKISSDCYTYEFEILCDKSFSTNLLYKKTTGSGSDTIYVSANTHTASAGGTTSEKVNSFCFGTPCDYEASLWAALVLNFKGYGVSSYLPYLITMADEIGNIKYLPESFLHSLTNNFRGDLLSKQLLDGSWEMPGGEGKYYDTALALLPFQNEDITEKTNTMNWLEEKQGTDGCWDSGNIRNTAFILYSIWPKGIISEEDDGIDCKDAGYFCMHSVSCDKAGGDVLSGYTGCFGTNICCSKEKVLESCSEQGGKVCSTGEKCSISTVDASDTSECCTDDCQPISETIPEKSECEKNNGTCKTQCSEDEKELDEDCKDYSDICCIEKEGTYWWIFVLIGLIILVVVGIIFKDKLRTFWFKIKSKFRKSKPGPRPGFPQPPGIPPQRARPRRVLPPSQRRPVRKPAQSQKRGDMDDVLKKLKEMGK